MPEANPFRSFPIGWGYAPSGEVGGSKAIPMDFDFSTLASYEVDLYREGARGDFGIPQGVYVDNADNANAVVITVAGTNQRLTIPAGASGTWPFLCTMQPAFTIASTPSAGLSVSVILLNVPVPLVSWGPFTVNASISAIAQGTLTDQSGTIALGGTSQTLAAANANRLYLYVQNPPDQVEPLYVNFTDAAGADVSIELLPGAYWDSKNFVSTEAVTVVAATTGHPFIAKEGE